VNFSLPLLSKLSVPQKVLLRSFSRSIPPCCSPRQLVFGCLPACSWSPRFLRWTNANEGEHTPKTKAFAYTSLLKRAVRTLWHVLEQADRNGVGTKRTFLRGLVRLLGQATCRRRPSTGPVPTITTTMSGIVRWTFVPLINRIAHHHARSRHAVLREQHCGATPSRPDGPGSGTRCITAILLVPSYPGPETASPYVRRMEVSFDDANGAATLVVASSIL
jgi:hypothetical protein